MNDDCEMSPDDAMRRLNNALNKQNPEKIPSIQDLCREGDALIKAETTKNLKTKRVMVLKTKPQQSQPPSNQALRYKTAYEKVFNSLPNWKQDIIRSKKYDDRVYDEFAKSVVEAAQEE